MSPQQQPNRLMRSEFLRTATGTVAAATAATSLGFPAPAEAKASSPRARGDGSDALFDELDAKIRAGMKEHGIPGVAVGVIHRGTRYIKGYGVTNVDYPVPVDGDTLFRTVSTTKTFIGTAAMRMVDRGKLDLDTRVRTYLPEFATSQPSVARWVTVRQRLNHSAGWLGEYYADMGRGDDALARRRSTPKSHSFFRPLTLLMLAALAASVMLGNKGDAQ